MLINKIWSKSFYVLWETHNCFICHGFYECHSNVEIQNVKPSLTFCSSGNEHNYPINRTHFCTCPKPWFGFPWPHHSLFIRLLILVGLFPNFLFIIIQEIVRMDISNNVTKLVTSATCKPFFVILHCLTKGIHNKHHHPFNHMI
jgi:hypothetical protein